MLNYQLPVIDTKTGINYINYDCARCNMENTTTIEPWKYSLNCSSLLNDKELSQKLPQHIVEHGCNSILLSPKKTRYCIDTNLQCHPNCKNKQLLDACHGPTQRIVMTDRTDSAISFKNEYCAMCYFKSLQLITFQTTCGYNHIIPNISISHNNMIPNISISHNIMIPNISISHNNMIPNISLSHNNMIPNISISHNNIIPNISISHNNKIPNISISHNIMIPNIEIDDNIMMPNLTHSAAVSIIHFSMTTFFEFDPRIGFLNNKRESTERLPTKCSTNENKNKTGSGNQETTQEGFNITSCTTYFTVVLFSDKPLFELFNTSLIISHLKTSISGIDHTIKRHINEFLTKSTNITFSQINFRSNYIIFHIKAVLCFWHYDYVLERTKLILTNISEILHETASNLIKIFKMQTFHIYENAEEIEGSSNGTEACLWVQYNLSEVHFTPEKIVRIVDTGEEYQDINIKFYKQKLYICHKNSTNNNYTVLAISTITCTILSIISILIRLYMQGRLSFLKNYTSKMQCNLCFALLRTYFSLLLAPFFREIYTMCKIMASLIYLGFVSTFTWMLIVTFNILSDFKNSSKLVSESNKSIVLTNLLGWGSPLVILITVLVLDFMPISTEFRPSLGNTHNQQTLSCWFDQRLALSIYFGIPSTTMILINSILFFLSLKAVRNAMNSSLLVDSYKLGIYIRLSIFMGITWIFALVVCFHKNIIIQIIFVISNSLQGFFILLSATCHKRSICSRIVTSRKQTRMNHSSFSRSNNLETLSSDIK